jgi:signal transduction histidine kinase/HPt (histidine-containing phosphotransfer) domain-containing protein/DNA-binding response OmpR family regulator
MSATPAGTAAGRGGLLTGLLAPLVVLALVEAAFAASRSRAVFLVVAAVAGLGWCLAWSGRRTTAAWAGVVASFVPPYYALSSGDRSIGALDPLGWLALGLAVAALVLPFRTLAVLAPVQLLLLAGSVLAGPGSVSAGSWRVLAFAACGTALSIVYSWHAQRGERERRQALEGAEQASRARAELLSRVSHELRTPLNVIGGMGELLERTPLSGVQKDYLAAIRRSSAHLLRMIEDVLDVSGLGQGEPSPPPPATFSLTSLLGETARALAPHAEEKGLALVCDLAPELPDAVLGHPDLLRRALEKLLHNAIKFSERGEVVLRAHPAGDEGRPLVELSVSDSGIGIPTAEGSGLGLSVAAQLVERMGGRIRADSTPGRGSRFRFAVPLAPVPALSPGEEAVSFQGLRALVCEGGPGERETVGRLLRSFGLEPALVAEADAAVEELHRAAGEGRPFAVVIHDASMRGSAALRARRKEDDPVVARTPKIRLSSQSRLAAAAQEPGPRVLKPVTRPDLLAALRQALRGEAPAVTGETPPRDRTDRLRVLVVDESPASALVTRRIVELAGGESVVVAGPDRAEAALAEGTIAAAVLDPTRADHRDWEARLRKSRPGLAVAHAPVGEADLRAALERIRRPAPTALPAGPWLDRRRLVHNLGDDEQAADQVLSAFVAQAGGLLEALRGACVAEDLRSVARTAHRLKGSLLWIGANRTAEAVAGLESAASASDASAARAALETVEGEVLAIVSEIRGTTPS